MKRIISFGLFVSTLAVLVSPNFARASGYILLSSYSGQVGSMTTVSGEGFQPLETISIYAGSVTMPLAVTNASLTGSLAPIAVMIPSGVVPESKVEISAKAASVVATTSFYVEGYFPSIFVSSTGNTPFSNVTVTGSGFAPSENVAVTMGTFLNQSAVTDNKGNLPSLSFEIPMVNADSYTINAQGVVSKNKAVSYFYIGGFYPNVFPSAYYLIPGQTIKFNGGGFAPREKVQVFAGASAVSEFTVASDGSYKDAGSYDILLNAAGGMLTFKLRGQSSNTEVSADISVGKYNPQVFPSSYFLLPGDIISFSGIDFAPYEAIRVYEGQNPIRLNMVTADANGSFPANSLGFKIPADFASTKRTVKIVGEVSQIPLEFSIAVGKFTPQLSPSSYYVKPGEKITVDGWNLMPHEDVDVTASGREPEVVTANKTGNIKLGPINIPFRIPTFVLEVFGRNSGGKASLNLPVSNYFPTVSASSYYVKPGEMIWFSGGAFAANETVNVSVKNAGGNDTLIGTIATNKDGYLLDNSFPTGLTTPSGERTYTFRGGESDAVSVVKLEIASFVPLISSDNYYPAPGSTIRIWVSGFGPSESLDISIDNQVAKTVVADEVGSAGPISLVLPLRQKAATILVTGAQTGVSKSLILSLSSFSPVVLASTYYTLPGNSVTFSGWNFAPNETVSISSDAAVLGSLVTDTNGKFTSNAFTLPFGLGSSTTYSFVGDQSEQVNTVEISLGSYNPYLLLSLYYGKADASITISGFAFAPNEQVSVKFGNVDLGVVTADAKGSFVLKTTVPQGSGMITAMATGQSSGTVGRNNFMFAIY